MVYSVHLVTLSFQRRVKYQGKAQGRGEIPD
jgi:hypothetical protein